MPEAPRASRLQQQGAPTNASQLVPQPQQASRCWAGACRAPAAHAACVGVAPRRARRGSPPPRGGPPPQAAAELPMHSDQIGKLMYMSTMDSVSELLPQIQVG